MKNRPTFGVKISFFFTGADAPFTGADAPFTGADAPAYGYVAPAGLAGVNGRFLHTGTAAFGLVPAYEHVAPAGLAGVNGRHKKPALTHRPTDMSPLRGLQV